MLAGDYGAQARRLNVQAQKAIQYNIAKREVDSNRLIYEGMLQRVKDAGVAGAAVRASGVRVIDTAKMPTTPYKPKLWQNVAFGLFAGTLFGMAPVILLSTARRRLHEPGDTSEYLNLRELGVIPSIQRRSWFRPDPNLDGSPAVSNLRNASVSRKSRTLHPVPPHPTS